MPTIHTQKQQTEYSLQFKLINQMIIRLLNPRVVSTSSSYTEESKNIAQRLTTLSSASIQAKNDKVDLLVTSHNFFYFTCNRCIHQNLSDYISNCILPLVNSTTYSRTPLVVGFDIDNNITNPFGGINGAVSFLDTANGFYTHVTSIWESWIDVGHCSQNGFVQQNPNRIFTHRGRTIGLLSCGDTLKNCYGSYTSNNMPTVDVYINPSHVSVKRHASQHINPPKLIAAKKCQCSLGTRQLMKKPVQGSHVFGCATILNETMHKAGNEQVYIVDVRC